MPTKGRRWRRPEAGGAAPQPTEVDPPQKGAAPEAARPQTASASGVQESRSSLPVKGAGKGRGGGGGDRSGGIRVPLMSPAESQQITVPFDEVRDRLGAVLEQHGAAIVTGILGPEECSEMEQHFSADLNELLDAEAAEAAGLAAAGERAVADVRGWPLASLEALGIMERCQLRGLPHGNFAWAGRLHPRVRQVYEIIHGTQELVSSCDNSFFAPASHGEQHTNKSWPHVDINIHDASIWDEDGLPLSQWEVFQGLLYVWSSEQAHASTTVVWCGSHREVYDELMADRLMSDRGSRGTHFSRFQDMTNGEPQKRLTNAWLRAARRVPVPAGALLLWSSRTIHQGWRGGPRLVQPVCWEPKGRRDERARERKLKLAALGLPSTHWGSLGIPHTLVPAKLPSATAGYERQGLHLPLHRTLQPVSLRHGVSVLDMWKRLQDLDWMKPLPKEAKDLLEASLEPKILQAL